MSYKMPRGRPSNPKTICADIVDDEKIRQESWTFYDLFKQISTNDIAITWLAKYKLISNSVICSVCGNPCTINVIKRSIDGIRWRCPQHNFSRSIRKGSFFEKSHLSLTTFIWLMYMWSRDYQHTEMTHETNVNKNSTTDMFRLIRELLERFLEDHPTELGDDPPEIGGFDLQTGEPKVVEIDVTKCVKSKRNEKKHKKEFWIFGGIERGTDKCFLVPIEYQNKEAFEAAIIRWILPGTHIVSDIWAEYLQIDQIQQGIYTHEYVDYNEPEDIEIHMKNIDRMWLRVKKHCQRKRRTFLFQSLLTEMMWRSHFKNNDKFAALIYCIKHLYKV
ncbi:uncharacterized protein LOC106879049 [Octopus bimaculoides]|uniref:ISXO2-like transposase domain-containing protein n=1 Tax=Octopus bimaculoides TaxID=37653 RepID=A0A0L8G5T0_OCTBM|nr:uncharacterized protein LOC106879049 [Octopus bimaculoides]|eukprot:XP_014783957.1 PREDICTED: uncharacterized protein LOC106879049 [Octopus bimaculoides]